MSAASYKGWMAVRDRTQRITKKAKTQHVTHDTWPGRCTGIARRMGEASLEQSTEAQALPCTYSTHRSLPRGQDPNRFCLWCNSALPVAILRPLFLLQGIVIDTLSNCNREKKRSQTVKKSNFLVSGEVCMALTHAVCGANHSPVTTHSASLSRLKY